MRRGGRGGREGRTLGSGKEYPGSCGSPFDAIVAGRKRLETGTGWVTESGARMFENVLALVPHGRPIVSRAEEARFPSAGPPRTALPMQRRGALRRPGCHPVGRPNP